MLHFISPVKQRFVNNMRHTLTYQQKRKPDDKRQVQQDLNDAMSNSDELPDCHICLNQLTASTKPKLQCKHGDYCK